MDRYCLGEALKEAQVGLSENGIPIGSVVGPPGIYELTKDSRFSTSSTITRQRRSSRENKCPSHAETSLTVCRSRGHNQRVQKGSMTLHAEM